MAPHYSTVAWKIPRTEELVGCSPWGRKESDRTERLHFHFSLSCIGEGNGNPLQCSCLENPRDGEAWWAAVYGVAQSRTRLKQLSSSSSRNICRYIYDILGIYIDIYVSIYLWSNRPSPLWPFPICLDSWTWHSRFLCNIALYSIRPCVYHQSHPQLGIVFALAPSLHSFWSYFSTDLQ